MGGMILRAVQTSLSVFEIGLLYYLLSDVILEKEYSGKKEKGIIWGNIIVLGVLLGINRGLVFFSHKMFAFCVIITWICVAVIVKQNKLLIFVTVTLYYALIALIDFSFAFLSMSILEQEFDRIIYSYANSLYKCMVYSGSRIVMTGCVILLKKTDIIKQICVFPKILLIIDFILCVILRRYQVVIVGMIYGVREMKAGIAGVTLVGILLIIFLLVLLFLKNKILESEKEFLAMREELITQRFLELENSMGKNRQLMHDLKNHFIILKNYERDGNYKGIHDYIESVEQEFFQTEVRTWTGNQVADMLIEQKRILAEQEGIVYTVQAVPIEGWPFNDSDSCSLLGNLLDNAIDACKRMKGGEKWIVINIEKQKQLLFIKIRNTFEEAPVMKNGKPVSVKKDKKKHGYGLKSVERIVVKYGGVISYQIKENVFQANLSF